MFFVFSEIKRCEEMERKLRYIETEIRREEIDIDQVDKHPSFCHFGFQQFLFQFFPRTKHQLRLYEIIKTIKMIINYTIGWCYLDKNQFSSISGLD